MAIYHQMGHDSQNLLDEKDLHLYKGALISPVNYSEIKVCAQIKKYASEKFEMIFDPQLYFPNSERGKLPQWSYFPSDVDTADLTSIAWLQNLVEEIVKTVKRLTPHAVCSPAIVPRIYSDDYYLSNRQIGQELQQQLSGTSINMLQTLLVRLKELSNQKRAAEIASIITGGTANRVFLVLVSEVEPRRELAETEDIKGAMKLINYLENAGVNVLVGFSSSEFLLWKVAGATDCASGKFFNLRRFTPSRWDEPSEGGGQIPYWFEESVMAFLREPDIVRLQKANFISSASMANPYGQEILQQFSTEPGKAWLKLSWHQYLYWFADFEYRIAKGQVNPKELLKEAENIWGKLDDADILMDERQNDGSWIRAWRRALIEAFKE